LTRLSLGLGVAGLTLGTVLIGWYGFGHIARATLAVGPFGFAAVCAWQIVLFGLLGLCWYVLQPADRVWRLWVLIWGRMVRDAAGGLLPFSLFGGFVLGGRILTLHAVSWPVAAASTVVDLTAEFLAQIALVVIGVAIVSARAPGTPLTWPICAGLAASIGAGAAFIWLQRGTAPPLIRLSRRILGDRIRGADASVAAVHAAIAAIYKVPWRVALCTGLHLVAWFGTGAASWIAFRLLGANITFTAALGIEALLHAVLATAILVPGYAGVQEAAYAAVGALFGQPAELALSVSLLRRGRDVALGVPILLVWQMIELRRARVSVS
jgi:putative membrane protein